VLFPGDRTSLESLLRHVRQPVPPLTEDWTIRLPLGAQPVASNWRADDPVVAVLRSAALLWGHDLLTHPFWYFDTNFLHPAARIRAFSSCSWKGKKFSVIEAKLGVFFGGLNLRASVGRNFLSDERLSFLR
jgi:hypothetical protein